MSKKGELVRLIRSLDKSEKRHFTLLSRAFAERSRAAALFDAIEQGAADDEAIRRRFAGERFVKQLHVAKNYLTNLIMRSLRLYHAHRSAYARLLDMLHDIEILYRRELYDHCSNVVARAEKLATEYERDGILLEVMAWKRRLALARKSSGPAVETLRSISKSEREAIGRLTGLNELRVRSTRIAPDAMDADQRPAPPEAVRPSSLAGKTLYHHNRYVELVITNRPQQAEEELAEVVKACREQPHMVREDPGPMVTALGNIAGLQLREGRPRDALKTIAVLRQIPEEFDIPANSRVSVRLTVRSYNLELELCRDMRDTKRGLSLVKEAGEYLARHRGSVPGDYLVLLQFQFAHLHHLAGDPSGTMFWANTLISTTDPFERTDIQFYARLLQLVAHTEFGNLGVLRYAVSSTHRYLRKYKRATPYESACLRFFARLGTIPSANVGKACLEFAGSLQEKELETEETRDYLDLAKWLTDMAAR